MMHKPKDPPRLMVAPNGARRPRLTIRRSRSPSRNGRDGLRHSWRAGDASAFRDADQQHVLDAGLYREALQELGAAVPAMHFQITTEAVGRYTPSRAALPTT